MTPANSAPKHLTHSNRISNNGTSPTTATPTPTPAPTATPTAPPVRLPNTSTGSGGSNGGPDPLVLLCGLTWLLCAGALSAFRRLGLLGL